MINVVVIAALLALQAGSAPQRCLTRQEAGDIALNAAYIGLNATAERCRPHVPTTAFLNRGVQAMLDRLKAAAEPRRRSAFLAFSRMCPPVLPATVGNAEADDELDETQANRENVEERGEAASPLPQFDPSTNPELMAQLTTVMAAAAISTVDTAACADANDFIEALSPLLPENIARLAGAGLGIAGTARPGAADSPLCAR